MHDNGCTLSPPLSLSHAFHQLTSHFSSIRTDEQNIFCYSTALSLRSERIRTRNRVLCELAASDTIVEITPKTNGHLRLHVRETGDLPDTPPFC